jgi:elongation factor G
VWRQADRYRVPRIAFLNKCDREGADPARVLAEIKTRLGASPIAIQLPLGEGPELTGVIDLIMMTARTWDADAYGATFADGPIPDDHVAAARVARDQMIEAIAELDDELMAAWVGGGALAPAALRAALRRITLGNRGLPALVGSAFFNIGIHNLLDAVLDYLPSPADFPEIRGRDPGDPTAAPTLIRHIDPATADQQPLAALAFKVQIDETGGTLTFVRVYAGCLRTGDAVLNATKGQLEHIGRLVRMFANHRENIEQIEAGMIGAVHNPLPVAAPAAGASRRARLSTGDTLSDPRAPILLDAMRVPAPVMGVVIEPETEADIAKVAQALERIAIEDPSFRVMTDPDSGQILISGMGELHLEIVVERMRREFDVHARVGNPQVAYRETVSRRGEGEHKLNRARATAAGMRGEYGHVRLVVEPTDRGGGYVYENRASIDEIPQEHAPAVEAGVAEAVERGVLAGKPMIDLRVSVVGGSYHPIDSDNYAFKLAGSRAFVEAAHRAAPTVLEPVMALEVVTPDEHVGDVLGDLHARRGKVAGITSRPGVQTVACFVPMASMFGYATDLRSRTRGRATYAMELDHYAEVPQQLRDDLIAARA